MVNQAALKAATDNKDEVSMTYLEAARHFVIAGIFLRLFLLDNN